MKKQTVNYLILLLFLIASCNKEVPIQDKHTELFDLSSVEEVVGGNSMVEIAFPEEEGVVKEGYLLNNPIEYSQFGDVNIFQGDIILDDQQLQNIQLRGAGRYAGRWPKSTTTTNNILYSVYYSIAPDLTNSSRVTNAIAHWEANTRLRFIPRTTQSDYIVFRTGSGCSSNVGRVGGVQYINLSPSCSLGNTIHEIGHAIGLWHEHTRDDRDVVLTINSSNIQAGAHGNFLKYSDLNMDGFDYSSLDFNSVMMYDSYAFSSNGYPTIVKKDGSTFTSQRNGLSPVDIATVNYMYPQYDWKLLPGEGTDIAVNATGTVYIVGNSLGNYSIYRWNGSNWTNVPFHRQGMRISVDSAGDPWVIDRTGKIFRYVSNLWSQLPGEGSDIAISNNGDVYIVGNASGGYKIYKWNGSDWTQVLFGGGQGLRVAVDPSGNPWVVNRDGVIYRRNSSGVWGALPGGATDITVGSSGTAYIIGSASGDYGVYKFDGSDWLRLPGGGRNIAAGVADRPWITEAVNKLYYLDF